MTRAIRASRQLKGLTYDTTLENVTTRKVNSLEDILE
eukprot:COSAG01_NODE_436_length_17063_cov_42.157628_18_plen_37_part_00